MNVRRVLDVDALPFRFPDMVIKNNDSESRELLVRADNGIARAIWESSPHRFWYDNKIKGFKFVYYCRKDQDRCRNSHRKPTTSQRDREKMERFECQSSLVLQVDLGWRFVKVFFDHKMYEPYVDIY